MYEILLTFAELRSFLAKTYKLGIVPAHYLAGLNIDQLARVTCHELIEFEGCDGQGCPYFRADGELFSITASGLFINWCW